MVLLWFRKNIISTFVEIIFWLPFTDTFLTNVPSYGSSKMARMRVLLDDAKDNENLTTPNAFKSEASITHDQE